MKILILIFPVLVFSQAITIDNCLSMLFDFKANTYISPHKDWVAYVEYSSENLSEDIYLFPYCDTTKKTKVLSIKKNNNATTFDVNIIYDTQLLKQAHYMNAWDSSQNFIYLFGLGSEYQTLTDEYQVLKLDVSSITQSTGIQGSGTPPPNPKLIKVSNYPNPFNPNTKIEYSLPKSGNVLINIYNIEGNLVKAFDQNIQTSGTYSIIWDGRNQSGQLVSAGEYFYQIIQDDQIGTKKMILLK